MKLKTNNGQIEEIISDPISFKNDAHENVRTMRLEFFASEILLISIVNVHIFTFVLAGAEGFEPPMAGPEPAALPLGYAPTLFTLDKDKSPWLHLE